MAHTQRQSGRIAGLLILIVVLSLGLGSSEAGIEGKRDAKITFIGYGIIENWQAEGPKALLIKTVNDRWYRAAFRFPCFELPSAERIGFVTSPEGQLNRFSSIIAGSERCKFDSLEEIADPSAPGTG